MIRCLKPFLVVALMSVLAACTSGPPIPDVDFKPDYDFHGVKTYAFSAEQSVGAAGLMSNRIEQAIEAEMMLKGITLVAADKADVLLRFMLVTEDKQDVKTYDRYYGGGAYNCYRCGGAYRSGGMYGGGYGGTEVRVINYTEGTLVIDLVDPTLERTIWHAVSKGKISKDKTPEERDTSAKAVIGAMLAEFPPQ